MFVINGLGPGGAERAIVTNINYHIDRGRKVVLLTWSDGKSDDFYEIPQGVIREKVLFDNSKRLLRNPVIRQLHRMRVFRNLVKKYKPQAVISFVDITNVLCLMASIGLDIRLIVSERTDPALTPLVNTHWRFFQKKLYKRAYAVVVQSVNAAIWVKRECGVTAHVIPNMLRTLPKPTAIKESMITAVGRLDYYKGFDILLKAFAQIASKHPDWNVTIVGKDGGYKKTLDELCESLHIADRVFFTGLSSEVERYLDQASIFVLPSRFEGFPNALIEAMAMGACVISSDCKSGPADIINHGTDGLLYKTEDVDALVQYMDELINDKYKREAMGVMAMSVRKRYAAEVIMPQWESIIFN